MKKQEEEKRTLVQRFGISTLIIGIIMFIISLSFFLTLSTVVEFAPGGADTAFGFQEILFSVFFALVVTAFLVWVKSMIEKNAYLGFIIGLLALISFEYSLFFRYSGPYTSVFATIAGVAVLAYLTLHFFKNRKQEQPKREKEN